MRPKPLAIFTAAIAVLFVLTLWWNHRDGPSPPTDEKIGQKVLSPKHLQETTEIRIRREEEKATLTLHDNWWQIEEHHNLPVNNNHLRALASSLTEGEITRFVTSREERSERLGFPGRTWEFLSADGDLLAALETGRATADGRTYFRFKGEDSVYLGDFRYDLPSSPQDCVDRHMNDFSLQDLRAATITLENGESVTLKRESPNDRWSSEDFPEGSRLRQPLLNDLFRSWGRIRLQATHDLHKGEEFTTTHPTRKATLEFFNRSPVEIQLSRFTSEEDSEDPEEETQETVLTTIQVIPEQEPHRLHQFNRQRLLEIRNRRYDEFPTEPSDLARIPREKASPETPQSETSDSLP